MPLVKPFTLDQWIAEYRPHCKTFIHDSCIAPLSIGDLRALAKEGEVLGVETPLDESTSLSYGPTRGSMRLRNLIAATFSPSLVQAEDILVTSGAISANFLITSTLCGPGDHVICAYPTYNQLFELPRHAGAEVSLWRQKEEMHWRFDVEDLRAMVMDNTKMIIINNPSNPMGFVLSRELLEQVIAIAAPTNILVFSDEVFRPLFHEDGAQEPPSLLQLNYANSIVTGSMSKAYALPGIRLGWIAVHPSLRTTTLQHLVHTRDYLTIAVSQVDDQIASFALQPSIRAKILRRSAAITQRNISLLERWVDRHSRHTRFVLPKGGGTCILIILGKDGKPIDDGKFCAALAMEEATLCPPANVCFGSEGEDLRGGLRVGIVMEEGVLEDGLRGIESLMIRWGLSK